MSTLEIVLMIVGGTALLTWITITVIKFIKNKNKKENEEQEEEEHE